MNTFVIASFPYCCLELDGSAEKQKNDKNKTVEEIKRRMANIDDHNQPLTQLSIYVYDLCQRAEIIGILMVFLVPVFNYCLTEKNFSLID